MDGLNSWSLWAAMFLGVRNKVLLMIRPRNGAAFPGFCYGPVFNSVRSIGCVGVSGQVCKRFFYGYPGRSWCIIQILPRPGTIEP